MSEYQTQNIDKELWDSAQKAERKRILKIIKGLSSHSTHGEHCYKLHSFTQLLKRQIKRDEDYVIVEFDVKDQAEQILIDALMNEGILRERERIIKLISHEIGVMEKAGGATFGKRKDYDEGYNTALRDIAILIKGENK